MDNKNWSIHKKASIIIHHIFTIPIAFVHRHDRFYSISHQFTCHRHFHPIIWDYAQIGKYVAYYGVEQFKMIRVNDDAFQR